MPACCRSAVLPLVAGLTIAGAFSAPAPTSADSGPVWVVGGRPDVPVFIDGVDARGAVVSGDWGLRRPGFQPTVELPPLIVMPPFPARPYFPATGRPPRYGRLEAEPRGPRRRPPAAESFHRSWSSGGDAPPAVIEAFGHAASEPDRQVGVPQSGPLSTAPSPLSRLHHPQESTRPAHAAGAHGAHRWSTDPPR